MGLAPVGWFTTEFPACISQGLPDLDVYPPRSDGVTAARTRTGSKIRAQYPTNRWAQDLAVGVFRINQYKSARYIKKLLYWWIIGTDRTYGPNHQRAIIRLVSTKWKCSLYFVYWNRKEHERLLLEDCGTESNKTTSTLRHTLIQGLWIFCRAKLDSP